MSEAITYNAAYFIAKFEAIPEELWATARLSEGGKCCALGHCGCRDEDNEWPVEGVALSRLMYDAIDIGPATINDGCSRRFSQPTPKQRILAALREIQEKEEK